MHKSIRNTLIVILISFLFLINAWSLAKMSLSMGNLIDSIRDIHSDSFLRELLHVVIYTIVSSISQWFAYKIIFFFEYRRMVEIENHLFTYDISNGILDQFDTADYSSNLDAIFQKHDLSIWNIANLTIVLLITIVTLVRIHPVLFVIALFSSILPL